MKAGRGLIIFFSIICALFLNGCTGMKAVPENEKLYTGHTLNLESEENIPRKRSLKAELSESIYPSPNVRFLWIFRPKLAIYHFAGTPKEPKGIRYWLKTKIGQPPVLFSKANPERTAELLTNKLNNKGFFKAKVTFETIEKERTASIVYTAKIRMPYIINEIHFPDSSTELNKNIALTAPETTLKKGNAYDLEALKTERNRIDSVLKEKGYFYFNPEFLLFQADTTIGADSIEGNRQVNLFLKVKDDIPREAINQYRIKNVYIHAGPQTFDTTHRHADTILVNGINYIPDDTSFRPKVVVNSVFFRPDSLYQRNVHQMTLSRLTGLGTFKFVNVSFDEPDSASLNANIYLSPAKKKTLRTEFELVSKSNSFAGPGVEVSYRNRNLWRGAELLVVNLTANFETQISGQSETPLTSYEFGTQTELYIPKLISPVRLANNRSFFVPKTRFKMGFSSLNRALFYSLRSLNFAYGYRWRRKITHDHELNPVVISSTVLGRTTEAFDSIVNRNLFLRQSFDQQFIIGSNYSYTYNNRVEGHRKFPVYFNVNGDVSGFLPIGFLSKSYAQYSKLDFDFRQYVKLAKDNLIATRLIAGVGMPYGNSSTLPYVKQFFIGGPNSIRAFRSRSLGPGTYRNPALSVGNNTMFVDQSGDIKIETNLEYRFPLMGFVKGALFVDAGNIWLANKDTLRPGGEFQMNSFLSQMAVGTGFGIRFDITFFIIRFDFGFPVRIPSDQAAEWMIKDVAPIDPNWRRQNMVLNIAIGYPF